MITGAGREIIAKYMLGHTSAYATHIGLGCGASPDTGYRRFFTELTITSNRATINLGSHTFVPGMDIRVVQTIIPAGTPDISGEYLVYSVTGSTVTFDFTHANLTATAVEGLVSQIVGNIYASNPAMTFETKRLPIVSRGFANEDQTQLVFTAEIPSNERLVISEASLWTAASDPNALGSQSRLLFGMSPEEGWVVHSSTGMSSVETVSALSEGTLSIDKAIIDPIFAVETNNSLFQSLPRQNQYEGGRLGKTSIGMRGDTATITRVGNYGSANAGSSHIHIDTRAMDFSANSTGDELRLALSVSTAPSDITVAPQNVKLLVEFLYSESDSSGYAKLYTEIPDTELGGNRYKVVSVPLSNLAYSSNFSWSNVRTVKISVQVEPTVISGLLAEDYFVFLDGMRFENLSSNNPLYGMTGYSIVRNGSLAPPMPIVSDEGEPGYIEFRLNVEVL